MPKSILRRFPKGTPDYVKYEKVVNEFIKHLEDSEGIPSYFKCARKIDTRSNSIFKIMATDSKLRAKIHFAIAKRIQEMDEEDFLNSLSGAYPPEIRREIDKRLMKIILSHLEGHTGEIASVTPVTTQLGIDFRTYQRLIKLYPTFHKEIDKVVGFQIFSLKPKEFLNSYRKRTCVSEGIRQAIELYLQTIIIRKMHFSREYHSTVAAREFGVDKGTVRRLKQKYPTFSSIIKILKNYNELKETYLLKHSGISYTMTEKDHNISNILSLISNFYDLTKIYAISYHIKNLKKINHKEYKMLLDFVYSLNYNIDWHSQISYSSDLNSSESFYIYGLTRFIDKIGPTNFLYKRYRITLLIYLMLARFEND